MIRLYHDAGGAPLFTLRIDGALPRVPAGDWIEIGAEPAGALADWQVVEGALVRVSIDGAREAAIARVNAGAGEVRRLYITVIDGQELIYQEKRAEAVAYLADPDPDPDDYPFIAAEVGSTAETAQQVAQVYLNMSAILRAAGAALEHYRIGAIVAIEAATTPAEIDAAVTAFDGALAAMLAP